MPTISVKIIKNPRKVRLCEGYRCSRLMGTNERHVRLLGNAFSNDKPHTMYICLDCARESEDPKIEIAIVNFEWGEHG